MTDILSPEARSENMRRITAKDTKPELIVRRLLHSLGYRYRLHRSDLPGRPDIVFPGRHKAIFVHGCFWHRHPNCTKAYTPKSRIGFWTKKFEENIARDARNQSELRARGWNVLIIWECETSETKMLANRLKSFLED